jgi:hypothetical protein
MDPELSSEPGGVTRVANSPAGPASLDALLYKRGCQYDQLRLRHDRSWRRHGQCFLFFFHIILVPNASGRAKLERLVEAPERTPGVKRGFCPKLSKETLQPIRQKLEFRLGLVDTLGEAAGRNLIRVLRSAVGAEYPENAKRG